MKQTWLFLLCGILCFSATNAQNSATGEQTVTGSEAFITELAPYALGEKEYTPVVLYSLYPKMIKSGLPKNDRAFILYDLAKQRGKKDYTQLLRTLQEHSKTLGKDWTTQLDLSLGTLADDLPSSVKGTYTEYLAAQCKKNKKNKEYAALLYKLTHYEGIEFEVQDYDKVLEQAAREKKLIFMDAYTVWCAPCRMMSEKVFPQKAVGDFFNKNFICLKMDMEKGQGHDIAKKFGISAFPTFLLIDENEKVVFSATGYRESERFLQTFREALDNYEKRNE